MSEVTNKEIKDKTMKDNGIIKEDANNNTITGSTQNLSEKKEVEENYPNTTGGNVDRFIDNLGVLANSAFNTTGDILEKVADGFGDVVDGVVSMAGKGIAVFIDKSSEVLETGIDQAVETAANQHFGKIVGGTISNITDGVTDSMEKLVDKAAIYIEEKSDDLGNKLEEKIDEFGDKLDNKLDALGDRAEEKFDHWGDIAQHRLDNIPYDEQSWYEKLVCKVLGRCENHSELNSINAYNVDFADNADIHIVNL